MNVLHTRWRALVLALLLAVSLAVPAAAAETETAAEDLQTLADTRRLLRRPVRRRAKPAIRAVAGWGDRSHRPDRHLLPGPKIA